LAVGLLIGMPWEVNLRSLSQNGLLTMVVFIATPFVLGVLAGSLVLAGRKWISR
jgi:hypothetical protein